MPPKKLKWLKSPDEENPGSKPLLEKKVYVRGINKYWLILIIFTTILSGVNTYLTILFNFIQTDDVRIGSPGLPGKDGTRALMSLKKLSDIDKCIMGYRNTFRYRQKHG